MIQGCSRCFNLLLVGRYPQYFWFEQDRDYSVCQSLKDFTY